eukprot:scaffold14122_cov130-Skeletonema_menzelii.AAC.1
MAMASAKNRKDPASLDQCMRDHDHDVAKMKKNLLTLYNTCPQNFSFSSGRTCLMPCKFSPNCPTSCVHPHHLLLL